MTAGWVAATARGRAMLRHTLGVDGAAEVARASDWNDARRRLGTTLYGRHLPATADRAAARTAAHSATVWQLRALSGWLPPSEIGLARLAAAPTEIRNIERHLARLGGADPTVPIELGTLGAAWPRLATATSADEVRTALTRSAWGDPGGTSRAAIALGLRVALCRRVARFAPGARDWAHGSLAVLVARERFVFGRDIDGVAAREIDRMIGTAWRASTSLPDLAARLSDAARWPLTSIEEPADLWRAEPVVVQRIAADAHPVAGGGPTSAATVTAVFALLVVDLWLANAAIEAAGRGAAREVLDGVA